MVTSKAAIHIESQATPPIIPVVQGDTGRSILFTLADFTIPTGATATYYIQKPSGNAVYNNAVIEGNTITANLTAQSIAEVGDNYGQVRIAKDGEVVTSFDFILLVKEFRGIDATESITEMNIFDKAVQQAETEITTAKDSAIEEITTAKGSAIEEIAASAENIAEEFSTANSYLAGEFVLYEGRLYKFTADHSGAWTGTDAEQLTVGDALSDAGEQIETNTADITQLKEDITSVQTSLETATNWNKSLSYDVPANTWTVKKNIYVPQGWILEVESTVSAVGIYCSIKYKDGTEENALRLEKGLIRFRATKDILSVTISNSTSTDTTITITKSQDDLKVTNYYDKSAKISGFIQGGTVQSGYYHSDFIPIAIGETIYFNGYPSTFGDTRLFFYDKDKNYICSTYAINTVGDDGLYYYETTLARAMQNWTSGNSFNVAYVAFNMSVAGSDTAVLYRNNKPDVVLNYGQTEPESDIFFNEQQIDYIVSNGNQPISGKLIAYNGDSICESRLASGTTYNGGAYAKMIADAVGGTYENRGKGGGTLASGTSASRQVVTDVTNMTDNADLICFEGGINDYWLNVPLGDYTENDYTGTVDDTTICGALESIFRQATAKWVGKPIVFVIVHKIKSTVYVANSAGYTFAQAREKMIGICNKYAIPYYDAFAESGLNAYNDIQNTNFLKSNATGNPDGCHPNAQGYEKYYVPQLIALFNSIMPR